MNFNVIWKFRCYIIIYIGHSWRIFTMIYTFSIVKYYTFLLHLLVAIYRIQTNHFWRSAYIKNINIGLIINYPLQYANKIVHFYSQWEQKPVKITYETQLSHFSYVYTISTSAMLCKRITELEICKASCKLREIIHHHSISCNALHCNDGTEYFIASG